MTADEIAYVREWAAGGNEPRGWRGVHRDIRLRLTTFINNTDMVTLNDAGLTIARLADALEQACETAEGCLFRHTGNHHGPVGFKTMRANRERLIG